MHLTVHPLAQPAARVFRRVASWALIFALCGGCGTGTSSSLQPTSSPAPTPTVAEAQALPVLKRQADEAEAHAREIAARLPYDAGQAIDANSFGLVGDGKTDNTALFKQLLSSKYQTIKVASGDYVTGRLRIPKGTTLILDPGTTLRDSGELGPLEPFIAIVYDNVRIVGHGARIVANRDAYTSGEHRHGISIFGAKNVLIEGLESSAHGGDGFLIGGASGVPAEDIVLRGCLADNNRRQGLSVISGRRITVLDCEFKNTRGTAPELGIDVEPDEPTQVLDTIAFVRVRTAHNGGGGIAIILHNLSPSSERPSINIVDHLSDAESKPFERMYTDHISTTIEYGVSQ